jgi:hypothetical protein
MMVNRDGEAHEQQWCFCFCFCVREPSKKLLVWVGLGLQLTRKKKRAQVNREYGFGSDFRRLFGVKSIGVKRKEKMWSPTLVLISFPKA